MNPVLKKLGLKEQNPILVLNSPEEYKSTINEIQVAVHIKASSKYKFIQVFAKSLSEAEKLIKQSIKQLDEDGHYWLCYPKGTSKKYKADFNRDIAWKLLASYDYEPVSQIAIDDDWSALRFKHVDKIKTMKRGFAATEKGKERIKKTKEK
jgi:hypothetical protein